MPKRYLGNIITPNPQKPADNYQSTAAPGVWSLDEVKALIDQGLWPTFGNLPLNLDDAFDTQLYFGNGTTQSFDNGLDLNGEGGMVWVKDRRVSRDHVLANTDRGGTVVLNSNNSAAESSYGSSGFTFDSDGFTVGSAITINRNGNNFVAWSWRKAPKFFDVQTWTGDGVAGRTVSHNLGSIPGCIIVKRTDDTDNWNVYHRALDSTSPEDYYMQLNTTDARIDNAARWNDTPPTSTEFTLGTAGTVNASGGSYVAYIFAHNDGDGGFGPNGDQDVISCGSAPASAATFIDLGFEPQWIFFKRTELASDWFIMDTMRQITVPGAYDDARLRANTDGADYYSSPDFLYTRGNGFFINTNFYGGGPWVYIAIGRATSKPTSGSDVFKVVSNSGANTKLPNFRPGFTVDFQWNRPPTSDAGNRISTRKTGGRYWETNGQDIWQSQNDYRRFDWQEGWGEDPDDSGIWNGNYSWCWQARQGYFDTQFYIGNATLGTEIPHALKVKPEMIWVKSLNNEQNWSVLYDDNGTGKQARLNSTDAFSNATAAIWGDGSTYVAPTSSVFTVGNDNETNGYNNGKYFAALFATLPGISKIGTYVGDGTSDGSKVIDCGFSSTARFIMVKNLNSASGWFYWDHLRGIGTGNDPFLALNSGNLPSGYNTSDSVDTDPSGFKVKQNSSSNINTSSATYLFYAIS